MENIAGSTLSLSLSFVYFLLALELNLEMHFLGTGSNVLLLYRNMAAKLRLQRVIFSDV